VKSPYGGRTSSFSFPERLSNYGWQLSDVATMWQLSDVATMWQLSDVATMWQLSDAATMWQLCYVANYVAIVRAPQRVLHLSSS
jgi:hypothetical protein